LKKAQTYLYLVSTETLKIEMGLEMSDDLILSTLEAVPNRKVVSQIGVVVGVGTSRLFGSSTSKLGQSAVQRAINQLGLRARGVNADAVVGISSTATSSGSVFFRSQTIIVMGTAVTLD